MILWLVKVQLYLVKVKLFDEEICLKGDKSRESLDLYRVGGRHVPAHGYDQIHDDSMVVNIDGHPQWPK